MSLRTSRIVLALFLAALVGTAGTAFFPNLLLLTGPVTCPGGTASVETQGFHSGTEGGVEVALMCRPPKSDLIYQVSVPLSSLVSALEALPFALLLAFLLPPVVYRPLMSRQESDE